MILVPLPIWIALAALVALLLIPSRLVPQHATSHAQKKSWLYRIVAGIYYILIICNILMHTLEIVRLSLIHFGIGLLPFAYVGLIIGAALHWSRGVAGKVSAWMAVNLVLWLGGMTMSIVKVVGLNNEGIPRKGSKYPMSDQVLDVAVIAGVYCAVAVLEVVLGLWRRRSCGMTKRMVATY